MRHALIVAALVVVSSCEVSNTREVSGQLAGISTQQALVISETPGQQQAVARVSNLGAFMLEVPTGQPTRLLIAHAGADGSTVAETHIGPAWFTLENGGRLDLGVVRPAGAVRPEVSATATPVHLCPGGETQASGSADLPYDVKLSVGQSFKLADAFAEKGPQPTQVLTVTMEGSTWHLAELRSGAAFTVTAADCTHAGNRDTGRDRAFITWQNQDGSQQTDHLDLRYCESGSSTSKLSDDDGSAAGVDDEDQGVCSPVEVENCGTEKADCDSEHELTPVDPGAAPDTCAGSSTQPNPLG